MNADFPRILTLLRKERGISQKQAAAELSISQALLSHYEKGIRECGLDFVVRAADFYHVSCDYLLGRSPERTGVTLSVEDLPEEDSAGKENVRRGSILPTLNKKLLINSLHILYDLLQKVDAKELTGAVSDFLMIAVYRMFRAVYSLNSKNDQKFFHMPKHLYPAKSLSAMAVIEAELSGLTESAEQKKSLKPAQREQVALTSELLSEQYPQFATSLLNLVQTSEKKLEMIVK